jgi:hypothetical protein
MYAFQKSICSVTNANQRGSFEAFFPSQQAEECACQGCQGILKAEKITEK